MTIQHLARPILSAALILAVAGQSPAMAAETQQISIALPSMPLGDALREVARLSGRNLVVDDRLIAGKTAPAVAGRLSPETAVQKLLVGTGLSSQTVDGTLVISSAAAGAATSTAVAHEKASDIVVTGTKIRGAPVAAPVIRLTQEDIRNRGEATLAEAIRTIPQNFGGGQNPAVGSNVPASNGVNVGSASSVNLRGLGSDATLTLINGHRISYSASRQAIDISSIPLGAVDRVEIVPDGASALYGSDAVAGVVNVILKRDFKGLETGARLGTSTDGGDFEQRYHVVTGSRWNTGGFIATYEFGRSTAIFGRDRSYTAEQAPALVLLPLMRNHSATISGHQDFGDRLSVELDAFLNDRFSTSSYALNAAGDLALSGARFTYNERSVALAPTLRFRPGGDWNLFLTGTYARDRTHYDVESFFQGSVFRAAGNCYCNHAAAVEAGGDGTLFEGPGGPVKIALGTGYRSNKLVRFNGAGASTNISKTQDNYYGYGEVSAPLVSPDEHIRFVNRLSVSAAARHERYPGVGTVTTPKIAINYAPGQDFTIKASWGKSFRAPTLYQQYQAINVVLAPPFVFGGSGFPQTATALLLQGGNPDLKPERATSWSATLDLHPRAVDGLRLQLSYFRTRYRDRVVTPISFLSQALSDPIYADRLTFNPNAALQAGVIAGADSFGNATGVPYDPANVAVFIDDRNVNAGFQKIQGADLLLTYAAGLPDGLGEIDASLNGTYLNSRQQLDTSQPVLPLAGILFNPPHWSARGDLAWTHGPLTLNAGLSYVGGVEDRRRDPVVRIRGMTTLDLTARLKSAASDGPLGGLEGSLTIRNAFNAKPARIATSLPSDAPYDSTNYSAVGRFIAVSVLKRW